MNKSKTASNKKNIETNISDLDYETARDELISVVQTLEKGGLSLETALELWEQGQKLGKHCQEKLDLAQKRIEELAPEIDIVKMDSETINKTNLDA